MEKAAADPGVSAQRGPESGQKRGVDLGEGVVLPSASLWPAPLVSTISDVRATLPQVLLGPDLVFVRLLPDRVPTMRQALCEALVPIYRTPFLPGQRVMRWDSVSPVLQMRKQAQRGDLA